MFQRRLPVVPAVVFAAVLIAFSPLPAQAGPWWDQLPCGLHTRNLATALDYHANLAMNHVGHDPGWSLWYLSTITASGAATRQAFENAGIASIGYLEGFGTSYMPVVEIDGSQPANMLRHHWNWQAYGGGTIKWAGAWTWFDDADFARPYTRTHPVYGGPAMTYPDGTVATGFVDDDPTDPRKSRVYHAGCSRDVLGNVAYEPAFYNDAVQPPYPGLLYIPETGKYTGCPHVMKDTACPFWKEHDRATTLLAVTQTGLQGYWVDNMSPFNSFMYPAVSSAFGEWSVALFRDYLRDHFTETQLRSWGVLSPSGTYADLATFDVRAFFRALASGKYGWNGTSLTSSAWRNSGWINEPVWRAYAIYKRQTGTQALQDYYDAIKSAAAQAGKPDFLFMGNDPFLCTYGWLRGSADISTIEFFFGWHPSTGSRGIGLPPFARMSPIYKGQREQQKSRFANVWLYNTSYEKELALSEVVNAIYYEMLATHAMPKYYTDGTAYSYAGNPAADKAFFRFVKEHAAPEFGARTAVEDVGIYASTSSVLSQCTPGGILNFDAQPHLFAVWGWGTALSELHYQFRIIPEWKLDAAALSRLKIFIIPNSEVFAPADVTLLDSWVRNDGGILIVTGNSGARLPESGNFDTTSSLVLGPLTGVSQWASAPTSKTQALGNGRVRFLKTNIGLNYYSADVAGRSSQITTLASELATLLAAENEHVALETPDAPKTVGLTLYEDEAARRIFVDVNNVNVTIAPDGLSAAITPVPAIGVTVYKPAWWVDHPDQHLIAYGISPAGPVAMPDPVVRSDRFEIQVPSTTYYTSVILMPAISLAAASRAADGTPVVVDSEVVSAAFDDCFYIEEPDRVRGLRVEWSGGQISQDRLVTVAGVLGTTAAGERQITATSVMDRGSGSVSALAMSNRSFGASQGLSTTGLLVTVLGKVTASGEGFFCIDDGSGLVDPSGASGVRVLSGSLRSPGVGVSVAVTGVSTLETVQGSACRCVRARSQSDIRVFVQARLVGLWSFEGANPAANSAPGVEWSPLALNGTGAAFADGKLVLPRYQSGSTWYQSSATAMLYSDLGSAGYFSEMTQVAWVHWPGFSTSHYGRITSLYKFASPAYSTSGAKAGQSIIWGGYSSQKWRSHRAWEHVSGGSLATGSRYLDFAAATNPPSDRYFKLAQVLKRIDASSYRLTMYCDTGSGIAQLGSSLAIAASEVNVFGQSGTNCLVSPAGGPRCDGFGIMDHSWAVPASAGSIHFDEVRLYGGALTPAEIEAL